MRYMSWKTRRERQRRIFKALKLGKSPRQIAADEGISLAHVYTLARKMPQAA